MFNSIPINLFYRRYRKLVHDLPKKICWLALIFAPIGLSVVVFLAGLINILGSLGITAGISHITAANNVSAAAIIFLLLSFLAEGAGFWIKERQELLLTVVVRQLTYRRFRDIFMHTSTSDDASKHVLTYPGQISQFAYVVDFIVSIIQIIIFFVFSLINYGYSGLIATLIIAAMVVASIRLVHLIGNLWEQYITHEGERRIWIQRIMKAMPYGKAIPSWNSALHSTVQIRHDEERLLHKRIKLQVCNGFLEKSSLTVALAIVALLAVWLWPQSAFGITIILAARYLYSAAQNSVVDYRVIRLAIPMMRKLDKLEASSTNDLNQEYDKFKSPLAAIEIIDRNTARANNLRKYVMNFSSVDCGFIPKNPHFYSAALAKWRENATKEQYERFVSLALNFGLNESVLQRFWKDSETLSSGEKHRVAVALVLAEQPNWLILDDTFSALDPNTREKVATKIIETVPYCTLLAGSAEYVPQIFLQDNDQVFFGTETNTDTALEADSSVLDSEEVQTDQLDDSESTFSSAKNGTPLIQTIRLLFGASICWVILGCLLIAGSEIIFALTISDAKYLSTHTTTILIFAAFAAIIGSLLFFNTVYRAPIAKLGELHTKIVNRLERFVDPNISGAVVGRFGEDFSDLQMSIPNALASCFLVVIQSALLVIITSIGSPLFIILVAISVPLTVFVMQISSKPIINATDTVAKRRDNFIGAIEIQSHKELSPISERLRQAEDEVFFMSESTYIRSMISLANAYSLRTGLIQLIVLAFNAFAVVIAFLLPWAREFVAPAAIIYFASILSASVQNTVETVQEAGVIGLTTARVQLLTTYAPEKSKANVRMDSLKNIESMLSNSCTLVGIIGATGSGKSVLLNELYQRQEEGKCAVIPDEDPFSTTKSDISGLELARYAIHESNIQLILLDETLKSLDPKIERTELHKIKALLKASGKQAVIALHSRSNLDCFDEVVSLEK